LRTSWARRPSNRASTSRFSSEANCDTSCPSAFAKMLSTAWQHSETKMIRPADAENAEGKGAWTQSKPETRWPKAERNPKPEIRIHLHPKGVAPRQIKPFSDFSFRPSFGLRVSVLGFQDPLPGPISYTLKPTFSCQKRLSP